MLIKVDKDNVKIIDKPILHKGEYGVHKCNFSFTEEYNGLIKMAVFKSGYSVYKVDIIDNVCNIPSEVLNDLDDIIIGVYGYIVNENEELQIRYSPVADTLRVSKGSYTDYGKTAEQVTVSQYEIYSQALSKGLEDVKAVENQLLEDKENGVFDGKDYEITENDYKEIGEIVKTDIQPIIQEIETTSKHAESIAKGRATGYVFDTVEDLDLWLQDSENTSKLVLGDNLYIRAVGVPDYWWDGDSKQQLETQKVDLTEYVKEEDSEELIKNTLQNGITQWSEEEQFSMGINYNMFGLGGTCRSINNGDLNSDCSFFSGFYMGSNLKNAPNNSTAWFYIIHMVHNEKYQKQLAFGLLDNSFHMRTLIEGTWSEWV